MWEGVARDDRADEKYVTECYFRPSVGTCVVTYLDASNVAAPADSIASQGS